MYVCVCRAVSERQIRRAADEGARSLGDLQSRMGVATCCGQCADTACEVLEEHLSEADPGGAQAEPGTVVTFIPRRAGAGL